MLNMNPLLHIISWLVWFGWFIGWSWNIYRRQVPRVSLLCCCQQGKLMNTQFEQWWRSSIYQLFLSLSTAWKVFTIQRQNPMKLPIQGSVQAKLPVASWRQWRKCIGAAALEWEKIQGGIPLHEMYVVDTQEKTDPRNTNRLFLSHEKLRSFE